MSKQAVFTMKLEPELRAEFMAEAEAAHRPASQVLRDQIDHEPDDSHSNGLIEMNRLRSNEPMHRLARHEQGNDGQHHGTGETTQHPHLARAETVTRILRVFPTEVVGHRRDEERGDVRAHVPAIRQQRH